MIRTIKHIGVVVPKERYMKQKKHQNPYNKCFDTIMWKVLVFTKKRRDAVSSVFHLASRQCSGGKVLRSTLKFAALPHRKKCPYKDENGHCSHMDIIHRNVDFEKNKDFFEVIFRSFVFKLGFPISHTVRYEKLS